MKKKKKQSSGSHDHLVFVPFRHKEGTTEHQFQQEAVNRGLKMLFSCNQYFFVIFNNSSWELNEIKRSRHLKKKKKRICVILMLLIFVLYKRKKKKNKSKYHQS